MNILIVDDSLVSRLMVRRYLDAVGEGHHQFAFSGDGAHALEVLEAGGIDVVVTDLFMPEMDGYELIRAIGRTNLQYPPAIVVVTGTKPDEREWASCGISVSAVLPKPVTPMDLARALYRIEGRGSPDHCSVDERCRLQWGSGKCNVFERSGQLHDEQDTRCHRTPCTMALIQSEVPISLPSSDPRSPNYEGQQGKDGRI